VTLEQRRQDVDQEVGAGSGGVKAVTEDGGEVEITGVSSVGAGVGKAARCASGVEDGGDVVVAERTSGVTGGVFTAGVRAAGAADDGGGVVVAEARQGTDALAGFVAGVAGAVVVAVDGGGPIIGAAFVAEVDGGVVVAVPAGSDKAASAGEGALVAADAESGIVGVVADVDGGVVTARSSARRCVSDQVGVAGEGAVVVARGGQVVVADVDAPSLFAPVSPTVPPALARALVPSARA